MEQPKIKDGMVSVTRFEDASREEWDFVIETFNKRFIEGAGEGVLNLLTSQKNDPTHGWRINNYRHSLQSATKAFRAGKDEEYVVCCLLHDVAAELDTHSHDAIAARILKAFVSEENHWMVEHHATFQMYFRKNSPFDRTVIEKYRGHPHFERTMEFCDVYDQSCFDDKFNEMPIEAFEPMVRRLFGRVMEQRVNSGKTLYLAKDPAE